MLTLDPTDALSHNNAGLIYLGRDNVWAAGVHFESAIAADPANVYALNNLGVVLERKGRIIEARGMYERAMAADPDFAPARNNHKRIARTAAVSG